MLVTAKGCWTLYHGKIKELEEREAPCVICMANEDEYLPVGLFFGNDTRKERKELCVKKPADGDQSSLRKMHRYWISIVWITTCSHQ